YAKVNEELVQFINEFYSTQNIPLDAVYTGKMMMGLLDLVAKDYFPKGSTILAIHTGGLQGNKGMSERLMIKLPS
ncbi:MAG: 1-aminocyclopropane-1-carboxylate deaminase/D-cysteine desulfhydrase, partial [Flavobacteriales bacterium]|nr:1-aminocyclopropane-1-carboxylate deaminase/D-cysteine desulfhydrase [Flavobacteriales bacterium]